jgi:glutathione S-transferase
MALTLYSHPFSSYCQKVLTALYEKGLPFTHRNLEDPQAKREHAALWPIGRFPVLVDDARPAGHRMIAESTIIIEHLDLHHPGAIRLLPANPAAALEVRFMDRFFDNYIMTAMQKPVFEALRAEGGRKEEAMAEARRVLDVAYGWLEGRMAGQSGVGHSWAAGDSFSLADCAAAPSLFYADWVHPIGAGFPRLRAYRARLLQRPSFARAVEEARPYRAYFPLGAPDRD